jgi:hypothetical protein
MSKRLFLLIPLVIILSGGLALSGIKLINNFQNTEKEKTQKKIHYHAGFQVYIDGELQNFSGNEYMHETPCTIDGEPIEHEHVDEQLEKAHLHDRTGNVVHVHSEGAIWSDLFTNIGYDFPEGEKITAYANGEKIESISSYPITPFDSIVILVGEYESPDEFLKNAVSKEKIEETGQKSETCGS